MSLFAPVLGFLWKKADEFGLDAEALMREVGIDPSLRQAFERAQRYYDLITTHTRVHIENHDDELHAQLLSRSEGVHDVALRERIRLVAPVQLCRLSLTEISFLLGFSEASSFSRACRGWTGQSPSDHRNALLGG